MDNESKRSSSIEKEDEVKKEMKQAELSNEQATNRDQPDVGDFDLDSLRLSQNFTEMVGVKKKIITVPVRKPDKQWFIRVHLEQSYRIETAMLELKEDREFYLVDSSLWSELPGEIIPIALFTAVNRQDMIFLWPVRLPDSHGRQLEWHRSALQAAEEAMRSWMRVVANMSLGAYEVFEATGDLPDPEWPELSFQQLLEIAFKDRFIRSMDHIAIRKLRGEI